MIGGLYVLENFPVDPSRKNSVIDCDITNDYACNKSSVNGYAQNNHMSCSDNSNKVYVESVLNNCFDHDSLNSHVWHKRLAHSSYTTLQHVNSPDIQKLFTDKIFLRLVRFATRPNK